MATKRCRKDAINISSGSFGARNNIKNTWNSKKCPVRRFGSNLEDKKKVIFIRICIYSGYWKTNQSLIFGDSIVIFEVCPELESLYSMKSNDDLKCIYIPLDSYSVTFTCKCHFQKIKPNVVAHFKVTASFAFWFFNDRNCLTVMEVYNSSKWVGYKMFMIVNRIFDEMSKRMITGN